MNNTIFKLSFLFIILVLSCDDILTPDPPDCAGITGGSAYLDDCEQCVAGTTGLLANYLQDCSGKCGGDAMIDDCSICDADPYNDCVKDCAGNWGGTGELDECGVCNGGQDDGDVNGDGENCETDCPGGIDAIDCLGVCNGTATLDNCEICDSDPSNDCNKDCLGILGGTAKLDECGVCNGGQDDGDVNGDGENCETDCPGGIDAIDCLGVCNGSATLDNCEVCDWNVSNDCIEDCADVWGGSALEDECGVCDTDATNDCVQDCADVWGGSALEDECGVCEGGGKEENHDCDGNCLIDDFDSDGICDIDESNPWGDVSYEFDNITDESVTLKYTSNVDIYGFEFDVTGIVLTNVTSNFDGISLSNGGDNVLGISLSGSFLASGTGTAAVLYFEPSSSGFTLSIPNIIFAGRNDEFNAVELSISGTSSTIIPACSLNSYGCCGSLINGTWYADTDGDGLGDETVTWIGCSAEVPAGYVVDNTDEDDNCFTNIHDCAGVCNGTAQLDCDDNCRSASYFDDLGDGNCDTIIPVLDCAEYNCDNGDCGTWNGYQCMGDDGLAAIQWDSYYYDSNGDYVEGLNAPPGQLGHVYNISSSDYSIPNTFYWNNFYPAIVGTYSVSYCTIGYPNNDCYYGYYTTYINFGGINEPAARNECFELVMWFGVGPSLYNWSSYCSSFYSENTESCNNFFNLDCPLARTKESNDDLDSDTELEYQRYLDDQIIEQNTLDSYGLNRQSNINSSPTITRIDNPSADILIQEIDSDPNVVVQQGKNYILKYVRREISP